MPWSQFFVLQELDSQIDHLREELSLATLLNDRGTAHLEAESAQARRKAESLKAQVALREEQRLEAANLLPPPFLHHYDRVRKRFKSRPWVVSFSGPVCPACNIKLPSKLVSDAQRKGEPTSCPSCTRMLIWRAPKKAG